MCGIMGFTGERPAAPELLAGLERLEYRGYDSAGLAVTSSAGLQIRRVVGRVEALARLLEQDPVAGAAGIGHTRWATHGRASVENAHPQTDCDGTLAVVHNGIIENQEELRAGLEDRGHRFRSQTDTEVVAHLLEEEADAPPMEALQKVLQQVRGSYALAVIWGRRPGLIVAARHRSPLWVGQDQEAAWLASDVQPLLGGARELYPLDEDELALLTPGKAQIVTRDGEPVERQPDKSPPEVAAAGKGEFAHFMLKEIHEAPRAVARTLEGHVDWSRGRVAEGLLLPGGQRRGLRRLWLAGMGTAYHACLLGAWWVEQIAGIPARAVLASDFRDDPPREGEGERGLLVAVSQSGETADTLEAARAAQARGIPVYALCNVPGSTLARLADRVLMTRAGTEVAVAATKSYVAQMVGLLLLALALAEGEEGRVRRSQVLDGLASSVEAVSRSLALEPAMADLSRRLVRERAVYLVGRGPDHAATLEAALKLKEVAYLHAEAMAAAELKHGSLALIEEGTALLALSGRAHLAARLASNLREAASRGADVFVWTHLDGAPFQAARRTYRLPDPGHELLAPLVQAPPLQLLAYYVGLGRGTEIDRPRNLAKSVTVE
ncbi:glutamine--fructose-6-phosphate transaminase (isomerizing) [Limnochorda pilosa]|uniref:Glutamine--fructose-6-phosphate aminotransferase [isomerizing] n=1 Tax=Limnochorda pilosa TaxID=1555112 RepID=A0A0K2SJ39_LIMPI|nr:glutamine--fructose-6-phosphate transaminase (isomerizing) [Limnochorda pilosa]BAS27118.1 glutamine amidotransferase [Limnochorda pilosa]